MTTIQWIRQGGRRYTQVASASLSAIGLLWPSRGGPPVALARLGIYDQHFVLLGI